MKDTIIQTGVTLVFCFTSYPQPVARRDYGIEILSHKKGKEWFEKQANMIKSNIVPIDL